MLWQSIFTSTSLTWAVGVFGRTDPPNFALIIAKTVSTLECVSTTQANSSLRTARVARRACLASSLTTSSKGSACG